MILLYASRMENCGGPTPMGVGNMQHQQQNQQQNNGWQEEDGDAYRRPWNMWDYPQATPWSEEGPWQEEDVNGIQYAICHGCGGKGHIAPQRPSKGEGKGGTTNWCSSSVVCVGLERWETNGSGMFGSKSTCVLF